MADTPFDKVRRAQALVDQSVQEFRETREGEPPEELRAGRGSDDEYCSAHPSEPRHRYVAHSVSAPPIRYVDRCSLCGHISSRALRAQLDRGGLSPQPPGRGTIF